MLFAALHRQTNNNNLKHYIMKQVTTNVYTFTELSESAKQTAINKFRREGLELDYIYDEAYNSVKCFNNIFNTKEGSISWLDVQTGHIDNNILELSGLRLQKYLWNNYKTDLFKGKYYNVNLNKPVKHNRCKSTTFKNGNTHVAYYSAINLDNCCVMTGVCYDDYLLQPIYNYLDKKDFSNDTTTFEDLLTDCFASLEKSIEGEVDYRNSNEAIAEDIEANEYEFTEDGEMF